MRDPKRIDDALGALREYWMRNPDMRLGQIVANMSYNESGNLDPFFLEDDILLTALRDQL